MKVLAINGTYRAEGTTTRLTRSLLEGAASLGAETEMVMLRDCRIEFCTNCLQCYRDKESAIGPCNIDDDVGMIVEKIRDADGVVFASPVHNGFVTGIMSTFVERISFRVSTSKRGVAGVMSLDSRLTSKTRAIASVCSAGGMPRRLAPLCNSGTKWLKSCLPLGLHGQWIGSYYADAMLPKKPETDEDWGNVFLLRELTQEQLDRSRRLGVQVASSIKKGELRAPRFEDELGPVVLPIVRLVNYLLPPYHIAKREQELV